MLRSCIRRYSILALCAALAALWLPGCGSPAAAKDAEDTFSFVYMSDLQADPGARDYTAAGALLDTALAHESAPNLLVLGGDTVNDGSSAAEWADFWTAANGRLDDVTVASVPGNHDSEPLLAEQFDYPAAAPKTSSEGFFYTFSEGNIFFLMLDSNIMGGGNATDAEWVSEQLSGRAAKTADWRIAVSHHPLWPAAEIPKDVQRAQTIRDVFLPLMEKGGVDLVLCGHQHVYARTAPMPAEGAAESGLLQVMAASGAKGSYVPGDMEYVVTTADAPNYLVLEAGAETLKITAFDSAGKPFDSALIDSALIGSRAGGSGR